MRNHNTTSRISAGMKVREPLVGPSWRLRRLQFEPPLLFLCGVCLSTDGSCVRRSVTASSAVNTRFCWARLSAGCIGSCKVVAASRSVFGSRRAADAIGRLEMGSHDAAPGWNSHHMQAIHDHVACHRRVRAKRDLIALPIGRQRRRAHAEG